MARVRTSIGMFVLLLLINACTKSRVDDPCTSSSSRLQLYLPFAEEIHICDDTEVVKSKIPGFYFDDSFDVPDFEQYLLFQDSALSNPQIILSAVAGFGNNKLIYFNLQVKAKEASENLFKIQQGILTDVKTMLKREQWVSLSDSEYESYDKRFRLTIRYDLKTLRIIELSYRGDNWPA
jgi:hypothetical protein